MQRIVLLFSAKHLYSTFQFLFTANKRIMVLVSVVQTGHKLSPVAFIRKFIVHALFLVVKETIFFVIGWTAYLSNFIERLIPMHQFTHHTSSFVVNGLL